MATRSTIAMKTDEGKFRTVYCHWDGYPSYNGAMLNQHYTDPAKIKSLIDLGSISSLNEEVGEKHPLIKTTKLQSLIYLLTGQRLITETAAKNGHVRLL